MNREELINRLWNLSLDYKHDEMSAVEFRSKWDALVVNDEVRG